MIQYINYVIFFVYFQYMHAVHGNSALKYWCVKKGYTVPLILWEVILHHFGRETVFQTS